MRLFTVRNAPSSLFHLHNYALWSKGMVDKLIGSFMVIPNFITEQEETSLLDEINPHMKRIRYEKSHWDDTIHLYREREQLNWRKENEIIFDRVRKNSFKEGAKHLSLIHILDLHEDGVIKAHIDSTRHCGDVITGLSLLSDSVMRLRHKDRKDELICDLFLERRSLYRLNEFARHDFYHEILAKGESYFMGKLVQRSRRVSIILRDLPRSIQQN